MERFRLLMGNKPPKDRPHVIEQICDLEDQPGFSIRLELRDSYIDSIDPRTKQIIERILMATGGFITGTLVAGSAHAEGGSSVDQQLEIMRAKMDEALKLAQSSLKEGSDH
jgi:tRNA U34 5-carboxymethylaminomethyl modifying enzyme MnmG/GidA